MPKGEGLELAGVLAGPFAFLISRNFHLKAVLRWSCVRCQYLCHVQWLA